MPSTAQRLSARVPDAFVGTGTRADLSFPVLSIVHLTVPSRCSLTLPPAASGKGSQRRNASHLPFSVSQMSLILCPGSSVASAAVREGGVLLARTFESSIPSSTSMKLLRYLEFNLNQLGMPLCLSFNFRFGNCCLLRAIPEDSKNPSLFPLPASVIRLATAYGHWWAAAERSRSPLTNPTSLMSKLVWPPQPAQTLCKAPDMNSEDVLSFAQQFDVARALHARPQIARL